MARALGIDENRYTRYERAEVEPDLQLIRRMCELLGVMPNELLGLGEAADAYAPVGLAEGRAPPLGAVNGGQLKMPPAAWALARGFAELRTARDGSADGDGSPLHVFQEASEIYARLVERPFDTIGALLRDASVARATREQAARLRRLIDAFEATLGGSG